MLVTMELRDTEEVKALVERAAKYYIKMTSVDNDDDYKFYFDKWLNSTLEIDKYIINALTACQKALPAQNGAENVSEISGIENMSVEFEQKEIYAL